MRKFTRVIRLFRNYSKSAGKVLNTETKSELKKYFPSSLLFRKHKTPSAFYIVNSEIADEIIKIIAPEFCQCKTFLEINPGHGFITKKFLAHDNIEKVICIESNSYFIPTLMELYSVYSHCLRVRHFDFINMSKLCYQDKMDRGTRISDMLQDVPKREFTDDPNAIIFGAIGSFKFYRSLITSIIFQNGLFQFGRSETFFIIPPPIYIHLTCGKDIGYMIYRSTSILFQIFFEYKYLGKVPRKQFLPPQIDINLKKFYKLAKIYSIDPEYLYIVKITPRRNIYDFCPIENLQALWYFVKQNCISRRNRIIPNLEKWIPGCGHRLIINNKTPKQARNLYPDEKISELPKYSKPCQIISNKDYYPNLNIYTQFGDLSPSQMLTLFTQFSQWKEYSESPFLVSLESSFIKMDQGDDDIESEDEEQHFHNQTTIK